MARRSKRSCVRTASRCAIFRRASNIRRSAAGSRRAAAAISRRSTRTSTISSNRCASVTPKGVIESRRLPGSGAGPSPDRMMIGSEGILGIITQAWMRLQDRPTFRAGGAVRFTDFFTAARAVRAVSQAGLYPSNCRILDPAEAYNTGAADGSVAIMVLAFESADHDVGAVDAARARMLRGSWRHAGGERRGRASRGRGRRVAQRLHPHALRDGAADPARRDQRHVRDAITWERFEKFHDAIKAATENAIREATGRDGQVTCRFTHVYPDGPAPYFTFHALGEPGKLGAQWRAIKSAALDAVIENGGTVTHHHAVGRDHRPWYDRQRPPLFADALRAAKKALDPQGLLNPGVLIDP